MQKLGVVAGCDDRGEARMRHMQIIESNDVHEARTAYLERLERRGVALDPSLVVYVETVHRSMPGSYSWLCYVAPAMSHAA